KVTGDTICTQLLPQLIDNYREWEKGWVGRGVFIGMNSDGLFSMKDTLDGMEFQIGGSGKRPTINSYMYGEAMAIAEIADMTGNREIRDEFSSKAQSLKHLVETRLWDENATFFKTISNVTDSLVDVRELQGYTPWYMNLPADSAGFERAWVYMLRDDGFRAPYGPTTAEQSHPRFQLSYKKGCMWDGRTWPFATGITLTAMANLLNNYHQDIITPTDYFYEFIKFSRSQRITDENGAVRPWIDESQHPYTGDWMTRTFLKSQYESNGTDFIERGKDYNHSSFCDLLISGLVGIRPQTDDSIVINPLIPDKTWEWFCLDRVLYKGHYITVVYDRDGTKYNLGQGLMVFVDNELRSHTPNLGKVHLSL
ncbi:MAG: hypothetical protein K2M65_06595, partial [Muribaculaceae bacterium]|nr:hypothetical protein [Muribaculaceae bacterium]